MRQGDLVRRAVSNYTLALRHWYLGGETLALASLYVAAENLDKAVVIRDARAEQLTPAAYAQRLGIKLTHLQAKKRREAIFKNDELSYELAKGAVDGFEHGSMDLGEVYRRAASACPVVFSYVREALLGTLDVTVATRKKLLGRRYGVPFDTLSMRTLMRGTFIDVGEQLAADEERYPILTWNRSIARLELTGKRELRASMTEKVTVRCAEGVSWRPEGFEIHGRTLQGQKPVNLRVELVNQAKPPRRR